MKDQSWNENVLSFANFTYWNWHIDFEMAALGIWAGGQQDGINNEYMFDFNYHQHQYHCNRNERLM